MHKSGCEAGTWEFHVSEHARSMVSAWDVMSHKIELPHGEHRKLYGDADLRVYHLGREERGNQRGKGQERDRATGTGGQSRQGARSRGHEGKKSKKDKKKQGEQPEPCWPWPPPKTMEEYTAHVLAGLALAWLRIEQYQVMPFRLGAGQPWGEVLQRCGRALSPHMLGLAGAPQRALTLKDNGNETWIIAQQQGGYSFLDFSTS